MAHSVQRVGSRAQLFNDLDLIAVVSLLDREVASAASGYAELGPLLARWRRALAGYGPGTIDLGLTQLSETEQAHLVPLLDAVYERLSLFGAVPASLLQASNQAPGVHFNDFPAAIIKTSIGKLRDLLTCDREEK
jgi:hypothetical protein